MKSNRLKVIMAAMAMSTVLVSATPIIADAKTVTTNAGITINDAEYQKLYDMFDASYYAKNNQDVVKAYGSDKDSLFAHFISYGVDEGRNISSDFDVKSYMSSYDDLRKTFGTNTAEYYKHYVDYGKAEGRVSKVSKTTAGLSSNKKGDVDWVKLFEVFYYIADRTAK